MGCRRDHCAAARCSRTPTAACSVDLASGRGAPSHAVQSDAAKRQELPDMNRACDGSFHRHDRMDRRGLRRHRGAQHLRRRPAAQHSSSYSIPDCFDIGRLLLGILIFWGIAATSYRGAPHHRRSGLGQCRPAIPAHDRRVRHAGAAVRGVGADLDAVRQGARPPITTMSSPSTCACRPGRSLPWPGSATSPPCC